MGCSSTWTHCRVKGTAQSPIYLWAGFFIRIVEDYPFSFWSYLISSIYKINYAVSTISQHLPKIKTWFRSNSI